MSIFQDSTPFVCIPSRTRLSNVLTGRTGQKYWFSPICNAEYNTEEHETLAEYNSEQSHNALNILMPANGLETEKLKKYVELKQGH
ncbi:Uncharacterised protein [Yersinia nurmii]|uniref:Transposase n=1 Tax=Yersinia nurmii TaxID=685706 RepID=A0ABM9S7M4_9GAMM|nr:Uncharacterised protein [Yersinia nurmii]